MSNKENGGPAFPVVFDDSIGADFSVEKGMTLRDYFAAKAMQPLIGGDYQFMRDVAKDAYEMADAMLKEREK